MKYLFSLVMIFSFSAQAQEVTVFKHCKDGFEIVRYLKAQDRGVYGLQVNDPLYGIRNSKNEMVLSAIYPTVWESGEPGIFIVKNKADKAGLFDARIKSFIVPDEYDEINTFNNGVAVISKENEESAMEYGAVDKTGKFIVPVKYDYLGPYLDGLMLFEQNKKTGYIDKDDKIIIPAMYTSRASFTNGLAPVTLDKEGKYGYINKQNEMIVPIQFVDASAFYKGYAQVTRKEDSYRNADNAEMALMDSKGKMITDFSYNSISMRTGCGLFIAKQGKKYGALDSTGKLVVPAIYDNVSEHGNNFVVVTSNKKSGLANQGGQVVLQPEYDYISVINAADKFYVRKNGVYTVYDTKLKVVISADSAEYLTMGEKRIVKMKKDKALVYDVNGKLLKTFNQPNLRAGASNVFSSEDSLKLSYDATIMVNNLSAHSSKAIPYTNAGDFNEDGIFLAEKNGKYDFIDFTGKKLNTTSYYSAVNFSEGICALQETSSGRSYIADKNFNKIKELATNFKGPYSEGIALSISPFGLSVVYLDKKGNTFCTIEGSNGGACTNGRIIVVDNFSNYSLYDKTGMRIGTDSWKGMRDFTEGVCAVSKNDKWGFIDTLGKFVIDAKYDEASSFYNGVAIVKSGTSYMLINKKGEQVGVDQYTGAGEPGPGGFPVMKNGKVGLVNGKGETVITFKYDNITPIKENRSWAVKNKKWGLIDNTGKELTPFIYETANEFKDGYAIAGFGGKVGLMDKNGKFVIPMEYSGLGSVYKNTIVGMHAGGEVKYSIR